MICCDFYFAYSVEEEADEEVEEKAPKDEAEIEVTPQQINVQF